jgi:hypothetical protein
VRWLLPDIQPGDGAADDEALDLRGALEDGEVVGRAWSPAARMLTIMHLAWQEVCDSRWSSFVIFPALTEQRRTRADLELRL